MCTVNREVVKALAGRVRVQLCKKTVREVLCTFANLYFNVANGRVLTKHVNSVGDNILNCWQLRFKSKTIGIEF